VSVERRAGLEVHARLEHDLPVALRAYDRLDRRDHLGRLRRDLFHVVSREEADLHDA